MRVATFFKAIAFSGLLLGGLWTSSAYAFSTTSVRALCEGSTYEKEVAGEALMAELHNLAMRRTGRGNEFAGYAASSTVVIILTSCSDVKWMGHDEITSLVTRALLAAVLATAISERVSNSMSTTPGSWSVFDPVDLEEDYEIINALQFLHDNLTPREAEVLRNWAKSFRDADRAMPAKELGRSLLMSHNRVYELRASIRDKAAKLLGGL
ncbi:MAG: hypothetical protein JSR78_07810 [Proteobacteria bacterium]|nr:hypothetical protein [Pseudomonadota bacterium]